MAIGRRTSGSGKGKEIGCLLVYYTEAWRPQTRIHAVVEEQQQNPDQPLLPCASSNDASKSVGGSTDGGGGDIAGQKG